MANLEGEFNPAFDLAHDGQLGNSENIQLLTRFDHNATIFDKDSSKIMMSSGSGDEQSEKVEVITILFYSIEVSHG